MSNNPIDWAEFEAEVLDPAYQIKFQPVPRQRKHRNGWSPVRQEMFIFALSRCGSVARAARSVGMTPRSAYQLAHAPGADDFVRAWDQAISEGLTRLRQDALQQALGGTFVPVFRRGKLVRVEHRQCNRLALALLSGKHFDIEGEARRVMQSKREYRADMREFDSTKAEIARQQLDYWAAYEARNEKVNEIVERIGKRMAERRGEDAISRGRDGSADLNEAAIHASAESAHRAKVERLLAPKQEPDPINRPTNRQKEWRGPRIRSL
jgi:hypothetical protein